MEDTESRRTPRKRRRNTKFEGFYLNEKGETVLSSTGGVSENCDDDASQIKIKATKRKILPTQNDISDQEDAVDDNDKENGHDDLDPRSLPLDDDLSLDWHTFPTKGGMDDDNIDLYSGFQRSTIHILAEVHSSSPPGYVSPKQKLADNGAVTSPGKCGMSPNNSPSSPTKNGCIVSREDRITFHKRVYGSPTRKSTRIRKGTFVKPINPPQQTADEPESQACLVASSVGDSPLSDTSSPSITTTVNNVENNPVVNGEPVDSIGTSKAETETEIPIANGGNTDVTNKLPEIEQLNGCDKELAAGDLQSAINGIEIVEWHGLQKNGHFEDNHTHQERVISNSEVSTEQGVIAPFRGDQRGHVHSQDGLSNCRVASGDIEVNGEMREEATDTQHKTDVHVDHKNRLSESVHREEYHNKSDMLEKIMDESVPEVSKVQNKESEVREEQSFAEHEDIAQKGNAEKEESAAQPVSGSQADDVMQIDAGVGQSPSTESAMVDANACNTSLNTSTEEFVSADEMPQEIELPNDDITQTNSQHQDEVTSSVDTLPCTPPMTPTKKVDHLEEMRRSLTKDCSIMLKKTPTPPRLMAKFNLSTRFESNDCGNQGSYQSKESDLEESFHSAASGEEEQPKTLQRKQSSRQRTRKTLTEIMEEEDSDDDDGVGFPVTSRKSFASQFQKFLLLTKDLDDTPSDKGTPPSKAEALFQNSPAMLLAKQLDDFSLDTPVATGQAKQKKEPSQRPKKKMSKKNGKPLPSPPVKRKCLPRTKSSKLVTPRNSGTRTGSRNLRGTKSASRVRKEHVTMTPEKQTILPSENVTLIPVFDLAKESDKSAIQEYFSPTKLQVKIASPTTEIKKHCSPSKLFVDVTTPARDIQRHCSPLRVNVTTPTEAITEHCSPNKLQVRITSPPAKVLQEVCNSEKVCISLSKDVVPHEGLSQEERSTITTAAATHEINEDTDNQKEHVVPNDSNENQKKDASSISTQNQKLPEVNQEVQVDQLHINTNFDQSDETSIPTTQKKGRSKNSRSRRKSKRLVCQSLDDLDKEETVPKGIDVECVDECISQSKPQQNKKSIRLPSNKETSQDERISSLESEIDEIENEIRQVSLYSTKKGRTRQSSVMKQKKESKAKLETKGGLLLKASAPAVTTLSECDSQKENNDHDKEEIKGKTMAQEFADEGESKKPLTKQVGNNLNLFPDDSDVNQTKVPVRGGRKAKPSGRTRRKSTRLIERNRVGEVLPKLPLESDSWDTESVVSRCYSEPPAERLIEVHNMHEKALSYAGSTKESDTESIASLKSWQTGSGMDDFDPFPAENAKRKTASRRRSARIAKRQSLQLGSFDRMKTSQDTEDEDRSKDSTVGLSEREVKRHTDVSASVRKRTKSSSQSGDTSDVESIISTASCDSDIFICGEFPPPYQPNSNTNTDEKRSEDEQQLWEDFDLEFGSSRKQRNLKQKKKGPSRRVSARLHGGCTSFLELTVKGQVHEVSQDPGADEGVDARSEIADTEESSPVKRNRRQKKASRSRLPSSQTSKSVARNNVHCPEQTENLADDQTQLPTETQGVKVCASPTRDENFVTSKRDRIQRNSVKSRRRSSHCFKPIQQLEEYEDQHAEENRDTTCNIQAEKCNEERKMTDIEEVSSMATGADEVHGESVTDDVEEVMFLAMDEESEPVKKGRRQRKASKTRDPSSQSSDSVTCENQEERRDIDNHEQAENLNSQIKLPTDTQNFNEDDVISNLVVDTFPARNEHSVPSKRDRPQRKSVKSRRRSSQIFKSIQQMEESEDFHKEANGDAACSSQAEIPSDETTSSLDTMMSDVASILSDLEVGISPSKDDDPVTHKKDKKERKTAKRRRRSSALFKPSKVKDAESHVVNENAVTTEHIDSVCDQVQGALGIQAVHDDDIDDIIIKLDVGTSPSEDEEHAKEVRKKSKTARRRRRSSKSFIPVHLEELEDVASTDNVMLQENCVDEMPSSPNAQNFNADDVLSNLEVETYPSKDTNVIVERASRPKKVKKSKRRSSKSLKPVDQLQALQDDHMQSVVYNEAEEDYNDVDDFDSHPHPELTVAKKKEKHTKSTRKGRKGSTSSTSGSESMEIEDVERRLEESEGMVVDDMDGVQIPLMYKDVTYDDIESVFEEPDIPIDQTKRSKSSQKSKRGTSKKGKSLPLQNEVRRDIDEDTESVASMSSVESGAVDVNFDIEEEDALDDVIDSTDNRMENWHDVIESDEENLKIENTTTGRVTKGKHATHNFSDIMNDSLEELDEILLLNDDFSPLPGNNQEKTEGEKEPADRKKERKRSNRTAARPKVDYAAMAAGHEPKSNRVVSQPKVDYSEMQDFDIVDIDSWVYPAQDAMQESSNTNQQVESCNTEQKRSQRRKSVTKVQETSQEDKPKKSRKKKDAVRTDRDVEELYLSRGKTVSCPNQTPSDLLETIFESPVSKRTGTPILLSKRRYRRSQTFPEKPWRPRPGKLKTVRKKRGAGGRTKKTAKQIDEDELTAHLDEVLADLSELSPGARSPKKVMTPYPRQSQSRIN